MGILFGITQYMVFVFPPSFDVFLRKHLNASRSYEHLFPHRTEGEMLKRLVGGIIGCENNPLHVI